MINPTPIEVNNQIRLCQVREGTTRHDDEVKLLRNLLKYKLSIAQKAKILDYLGGLFESYK